MAPLDTLLYSDDCAGTNEVDTHRQYIVNSDSVVNGGRRSSTVCMSPRKATPRTTTSNTNVLSSTSRSTRKTVSFAPKVFARQVLHINNYSAKEIQDTWYTLEEYGRIKAEISLTVYMMDRQELQDQPTKKVNDDWYCGRGLESRTKSGSVTKRQHREQSRFVVFDMQYMYHLGSEERRARRRAKADLESNQDGANSSTMVFDEEIYKYFDDVDVTAMAIADIYQETTKSSALHAMMVGMNDAMEAAATR